ncbi:hypothetical protein [Paraburkholderia bannensis]|uniref:hypothetical protein n=1 Tax=Paraburkholderia bannensis TaxID=765414 RepID=UPI002ABDC0D0|nr:hypothetical protein [Paraburkholderia bannensis]
MRRSKLILGAAVAAVACASGAAQAARVGVFIGGGVPYYYPVAPAPYYWGPPPVILAPPPDAPEYIEQGQPQAAAGSYQGSAQGNYQQGPGDAGDNSDTWYYCDASKTYYPYVKQCSSGWRSVPAQTAPSN